MKVNKDSGNIINVKIDKLKELIPEIFTEDKIDLNKFKQIYAENLSSTNENYNLNWVGKSDSIKNIQTNSKLTLIPEKEQSINFESTENIFIEGDNLEVLKLLQKSYFGQIKLIYIDPPYNTGNDFVYSDDFTNSKKAYLEQTGQLKNGIKQTTNTISNGRYHSDWLSMMYPRLFIAHSLLKEDGVIFISINDKEVHNLRYLLDEIFGEENFIAQIIWNKDDVNRKGSQFIKFNHEYIIVYSKDKSCIVNSWTVKKRFNEKIKFENPDNDSRGDWFSANICSDNFIENRTKCFIVKSPSGKIWERKWFKEKNEIESLIKENRIYFGPDGNNVPRLKIFKTEWTNQETFVTSVWKDVGGTGTGLNEIVDIFNSEVFYYPKNTIMIKKIIELICNDNDIILDFFAGSNTTAQAVLDLNKLDKGNRKFICVQLPEDLDENLKIVNKSAKMIIENAINFLDSIKKPHILSEISKERIRRVIAKIKSESNPEDIKDLDLGFKVFKLSDSNYSIWNEDLEDSEDLKKQIKLFESSLIKDYKDIYVIYEIAIKEGYSLNSKINLINNLSNKVYLISDDTKKMFVCLDKKINSKIIDELKLTKEDVFVCLDSAIDDSLKLNLAKILKSNDINNNLKTI